MDIDKILDDIESLDQESGGEPTNESAIFPPTNGGAVFAPAKGEQGQEDELQGQEEPLTHDERKLLLILGGGAAVSSLIWFWS